MPIKLPWVMAVLDKRPAALVAMDLAAAALAGMVLLEALDPVVMAVEAIALGHLVVELGEQATAGLCESKDMVEPIVAKASSLGISLIYGET